MYSIKNFIKNNRYILIISTLLISLATTSNARLTTDAEKRILQEFLDSHLPLDPKKQISLFLAYLLDEEHKGMLEYLMKEFHKDTQLESGKKELITSFTCATPDLDQLCPSLTPTLKQAYDQLKHIVDLHCLPAIHNIITVLRQKFIDELRKNLTLDDFFLSYITLEVTLQYIISPLHSKRALITELEKQGTLCTQELQKTIAAFYHDLEPSLAQQEDTFFTSLLTTPKKQQPTIS